MTAAILPSPAPAASLLPGLDDRARDAIAAASRTIELSAGNVLYREGDAAELLYAVISGSISLSATRRGDTEPTALRVAQRSDIFGHEAALFGVGRRSTATALEDCALLEIPMPVYRRASARAGGGAEREQRYLRREVIRDLLASCALSRDLPDHDAAALLDAARLERYARSEHIFEPGFCAGDVFVVLDGLVQLQTEREGELSIEAYVSRGDFFGDHEALEGRDRDSAAVAMGDTWCAVIPAAVVRSVCDRHPDLLRRMRRIDRARREVVADLGANSTQHVFRDLYRMQVARSLLVIDQDSCVRCGHCAWSCAETHGVSRLVRRGERVVARVRGEGRAAPSALLVPNSCQQCRNAACMVDCPTGAIGRDLGGEVFIREDLCTGCESCAKACPWDNIQMAPTGTGDGAQVAVKCDLCRDYEAPACVQACPTESLLRLDPSRDIAEVQHVLGIAPGAAEHRAPSTENRAPSTEHRAPSTEHREPSTENREPSTENREPRTDAAVWIAGAAGVGIAVAGLGIARQLTGVWTAGAGAGLALGCLGGLLVVALAAYSVPKRFVRMWMKRRRKGLRAEDPAAPRSAVRPHLIAHVAMGLIAAGCAAGHTGLRIPGGAAGAVALAFWIAALLGAIGGLLYWLVPRRLSRLERRGDLPEDLGSERRSLIDRIYRETSGRSELVKTIADRILIPYARSPLGPLLLVASGRSLRDERRRLRARIDDILDGRGGERLGGLDRLIATVVETRALPARRWLSRALRLWLPAHIVVSAMALGLLALHVVTEVLL